MIQLENVSKRFRKGANVVRALDDVSLWIGRGEYVSIRGPSGSGKSTLLSLVGGLATPSEGQVKVDDRDLLVMTGGGRARWRRQTIGFVFQMFHLLPYLTVRENVLAAAAGGDRRQRAERLLRKFDLSERLGHRPGELSAGERQRVAMARALLNEPQVLLADEPTGNLDPDNAGIVLDLVDDFHRSGGTVLLVTHSGQAADRAQRSIRMSRGRIESESESPDAAPAS